MTRTARRSLAFLAMGVWLFLIAVGPTHAFRAKPRTGRFDPLIVEDPSSSLDVATVAAGSLLPGELARGAWEGFSTAHGPAWAAFLDRRSGAPMLVAGRGIRWAVDAKSTVDSIAGSLRPFIEANRALLLADNEELALDRDASGRMTPDVWQISFARRIRGVPVVGERYVFTIGHGNLIAFGAPRWSRIELDLSPDIDAASAVTRVAAYMGLTAADRLKIENKGSLEIVPLRAPGTELSAGHGAYKGPIGAGYASALVWRVAVRVDGEPGTWEARVDAHTGAIRSFVDVNDYAWTTGGIYPFSNDQIPPDGVEQPATPMPYADVTIDGASQTTSALGAFACLPGGSYASTSLSGPYVQVVDTCGPILEAVACDADLDLRSGPGTDCAVPDGASPGDTHAARTGFYHLNRIIEHARTWLPTRAWLNSRLTDNVNLNQTCNAYWDGNTVNFFKSGGGCNNTGEIACVFLHEWGHGLDSNDGGGADNPSEAYADVTAFLSTHASCVGRGFTAGNCDGYGDACLDCTGIRDQDWDKHQSHAPATPAGFVSTYCVLGNGACGAEPHCESHVGAEALWDLAVRDLPASGLDAASSWQVADRLWYVSRLGSGGNAYNCALPDSDGCAVTSWFEKLRAIDDDDGDLANGTPHAAAIYAAFARHAIACGEASDATNQSSTTCPAFGAPVVTAGAGPTSALLTWDPVQDAVAYNVLRNDSSCAAASTTVATIPGTSFTDTGLANGFTEYYTVQAIGINASCDGPLSNCQAVTPQPSAGLIDLDAATYGCTAKVTLKVTDSNIGAGITTATIVSTTEPNGETVTLTQLGPASAFYAGSIYLTRSPPDNDGFLSVADGDGITATYVDADDGRGGMGLARFAAATIDCILPTISNVAASDVTGNFARVTWDTDEAATSLVRYGTTRPPPATVGFPVKTLAHAVKLTGLSECSIYSYSVESSDAVGNTAFDNNGYAYYTFTTTKNTAPNFVSTDGPIPIPDHQADGVSSTIVVTDNKPVQKVAVTINVRHTYDSDMVISLIPPDGVPIVLSNKRGGSGDNFTGTVFDDAAAQPVAVGAAPFTGSFRPEFPLSALNGISAAGSWQLHVADTTFIDVGTIDDWTLSLTYPLAPCGPHAAARSMGSVADVCAAGGSGNADSTWDEGEQVSFKLRLDNDGTSNLTNVRATVTPTTPGVSMIRKTAGFPVLPPGGSADSFAPHFTALLPAGLTCGGDVAFDVAIASDQGSWSGPAVVHGVGFVADGGGTALDESFDGGIPAGWTVVDDGVGGGDSSTWTIANPGGKPISPPLTDPVVIVDSEHAGPGVTQDEQLISPALDLSVAITATLEFDQYFRWYLGGQDEIGDVDVRSSRTQGNWINVLRQQGASSTDPDHQSLNITSQAAGATDVQIRFHYYNGSWEWFWMVDDVRVDYTAPGPCTQTVCASASGLAEPVADGSFGTALTASRDDGSGTSISLAWDVTICQSSDHHVLYGNLADVAMLAVTGSACDLGTIGSATWSGVPSGDLWFILVGDDNLQTEASWGTDGLDGERGLLTVSQQCGMTSRDNARSCFEDVPPHVGSMRRPARIHRP